MEMAYRVVISLVSLTHLKKTCQRKKRYTVEWDYLLFTIDKCYKRFKRNRPGSWLFCWFLYHRLTAMSAHAHAYRYPLVESRTKSRTKRGLRAIALCRKNRVLLSKHK